MGLIPTPVQVSENTHIDFSGHWIGPNNNTKKQHYDSFK